MAENLHILGIGVTLVERGAQVMAAIDPEMVQPMTNAICAAGVDLRTLQKRMGHSDIKTTMGYLHFIEPEQQKAVTVTQSRANVEQNIFNSVN